MGVYKPKGSKQWWVSYTVDGTRVRKAAGTNKRAAEDTYNAIRYRIRTGEFVPEGERGSGPGSTPFEEWVDRDLAERTEEGKRESSYHALRTHWRDAFEGQPINSVTAEKARALAMGWKADKKWSPATFNNVLRQLCGSLSRAKDAELLRSNPLRDGIKYLRVRNTRDEWVKRQELEAMAEKAPGAVEGGEYAVPILLGLFQLGLRRGELCRISVADLQDDGDGGAYLVVEQTKNGDRLYVPLGEGALRDHCEARKAEAAFPGDYLFPSPTGGSAYWWIGKVFPDIVEAAELVYGRDVEDGITLHSFRHGFATNARLQGMGRATIQRIGNWKTPAMVERYAKVADQLKRDGADKMAALVPSITLRGCQNASKSADAGATPESPESASA